MFASALFLAQTGQVNLEKNEYWLVAVAVVATFVALIALLGAWALIRRQPPIEREIDNRIALALEQVEKRWLLRHTDLHEEMLRLNNERRVTMAGLFQRLEDYRRETKEDIGQIGQSLQKSFQDLNFSMGRIEGQIANTGPKG